MLIIGAQDYVVIVVQLDVALQAVFTSLVTFHPISHAVLIVTIVGRLVNAKCVTSNTAGDWELFAGCVAQELRM